MWEHLGRVVAEMMHLRTNKLHKRVRMTGAENLLKPEEQAIFVSGHFGNWELTYPIARRHGQKLALVYRHVNNPLLEGMLKRLRSVHADTMIRKRALRQAAAI